MCCLLLPLAPAAQFAAHCLSYGTYLCATVTGTALATRHHARSLELPNGCLCWPAITSATLGAP